MAERDLDRYLEGIGIDIDGDQDAPRPLGEDAPANEAPGDADAGFDPDDADGAAVLDGESDAIAPEDDHDAWVQDDDIDFERAMAGVGLGGVVPDDLAADQRAETFLVQLLLYLDPTYAVDVTIDHDGSVHADVHGGDAGRLIGKGGRTLAALEFLANAVVNKVEGEAPVRVNVDVGGYKRRRDERLRVVAQRAAARVRKSGMPVELEPMSAAERRVVHMALADDPAVESESSGDGRDRRVVVYPAGDGA
ncbi:MAG: KH domain-containing protein [Trueperaceae bacterium]|nr:KH domain-containing protein [Trueperaceae bacterium]